MSQGRISARLLALVTAAAWIMLLRVAPVQAQPAASRSGSQGLRHARLYGVASGRMFGSVNRNDARAALKVWYDMLGQQRGFILDSRVDVLDSVKEIRERLETHSADLISLTFKDYLDLESSGLLLPVLTDSRTSRGGALYSYVLLVKPSSGVASLAALRGKNILEASRGGGHTGMIWLEVLLAKANLGRAASFFATIKSAPKAQSCILSLFFGTVDGCLVDEVSLELAKEMNPQLGQLRVLARSRPMIEGVICVSTEPNPLRQELIDAMLSLHKDPRGHQVLMVFKTDRLVPIQPGDLDSARELWRDYERLPGSSPSRSSSAGPAPAAILQAAESNQAGRTKEGH